MRSENYRPVITSPVPREAWESLIRSDPDAVVTQLLAWRDAVFADGRYRDVSRLYEFPSGQQVALPLARRRLGTAWTAVTASWPRNWGVCGPISRSGQIGTVEAAAVLADLAGRGTLAAEIQLRYGGSETWLNEARQYRIAERGCHVLDLAGGFDRFGPTSSVVPRVPQYARLSTRASKSTSTGRDNCWASSATSTRSLSNAGQLSSTSRSGSRGGGQSGQLPRRC